MSKTMDEDKELEVFLKESEKQKKHAKAGKPKVAKPTGKKSAKAVAKAQPRAPFGVRTMRTSSDGKYGVDVRSEFEDLDVMLKKVKSIIEDGQGNGLHEVVVVVR